MEEDNMQIITGIAVRAATTVPSQILIRGARTKPAILNLETGKQTAGESSRTDQFKIRERALESIKEGKNSEYALNDAKKRRMLHIQKSSGK